MFQRLAEQDHYQVLEVSYDASFDEIQSAYEVARDIYSHDALVSGSILSEHERRRTFDRIAEAYQTLIAEESRRLYDERIGLSKDPIPPKRDPVEIDELAGAKPVDMVDAAEPRIENELTEETPEPAVRVQSEPRTCPIQLAASEEATGAFLQKAREALELEISTISEETKIGRTMLEAIEQERLDHLPAPIYLRNFTRQVARCLGLDEDQVSTTYLERIRRQTAE